MVLRFIFCLILAAISLEGVEVKVRTASGEEVRVELMEEDRIQDLKMLTEALLGLPANRVTMFHEGKVARNREKISDFIESEFWAMMDVQDEEDECEVRTYQKRDYSHAATQEEKKDIAFIVKTLANKPLTKLYRYKSSLEYAGARVDHIHPLQFLLCVFLDDELLVALHNLRKRGWVWGEFFHGFKGSLEQEARLDNMHEEILLDFCGTLQIGLQLIHETIMDEKWQDFIDLLISNVERSGESDRYDF